MSKVNSVENGTDKKKYRTCLPVPMFSRADFNVWSILKNCIGKELSKVTMPVIFNEPLSFLQRLVESLEYSELIEKANESMDPVTRLEYVTAFVISGGSSNCDRLGKPFNPILGETYEYEHENFRYVSEQVSHHPPVSAFHAESPIFKYHGTVNSKLKFWGKSIEIQPKGILTLELPKHRESYSWSNVNYCVHNIIVGKLWLEQYGMLEVTNHTNGLKAVITFKPSGWFSKDLHRVEGFIMDKQKNKLRYIYGKWTDLLKSVDIPSYEDYVKQNTDKFKRQATVDKSPRNTPTGSPAHTPKRNLSKFNSLSAVLPFGGSNSSSMDGENGDDCDCLDPPKNDSTYSLDIPNSTLLWECQMRPENSSDYFMFTLLAMSLNEIDDELRMKLPRTDSRLRPDVRMLEEGDIDGAASEKNRLEEKQRDARKSRRKDKDNWKPKWFEYGTNPSTKEEDWLISSSQNYWDRNFADSPDIF